MNNMRIGGLASGMDIDQLVSDLMKAERKPVNRYFQKKQLLEWQRDQYREMNTLLLSLREETFTMKMSSSYRAKTVSSSDESKVIASASPGAENISYSISKVDQLATAATKINAGAISADSNTKVDLEAALISSEASFLNQNFGWKEGSVESLSTTAASDAPIVALTGTVLIGTENDMSVKVDGKRYEVVTDSANMGDGKAYFNSSTGNLEFSADVKTDSRIEVDYYTTNHTDNITVSAAGSEFSLTKGGISDTVPPVITVTNTSGTTTYTQVADPGSLDPAQNQVYVDKETGKITFSHDLAEDDNIKAVYSQKFLTFDVSANNEDGSLTRETISVEGSDSLNDVMNKINASDVKVSAFYDAYSDRFTLSRTLTGNFNGDEATEEIITSGSFINDVLRFTGSTETGGTNAKFTINGLQTERNTNAFNINGVDITLKSTFDLTASNGSVGINVTTDTEAVFDKIKSYIDKYNEVIGKINDKTNEKRYRDFLPLTDDERDAMSEKEIEKWEERAQSGLLRSDSILFSGLNQMRTDFYGVVNNPSVSTEYNQIAKLGITTSPNYSERGKLIIDETKLKEAIASDPESVEKLFTSIGSTYGEQGIVQRLDDTINETMDRIKNKAGSRAKAENQYTIGRNLMDVNRQIDRFEDRLIKIEDRYWRQFTAMEKAISRSNEQSMMLMNSMGGF